MNDQNSYLPNFISLTQKQTLSSLVGQSTFDEVMQTLNQRDGTTTYTLSSKNSRIILEDSEVLTNEESITMNNYEEFINKIEDSHFIIELFDPSEGGEYLIDSMGVKYTILDSTNKTLSLGAMPPEITTYPELMHPNTVFQYQGTTYTLESISNSFWTTTQLTGILSFPNTVTTVEGTTERNSAPFHTIIFPKNAQIPENTFLNDFIGDEHQKLLIVCNGNQKMAYESFKNAKNIIMDYTNATFSGIGYDFFAIPYPTDEEYINTILITQEYFDQLKVYNDVTSVSYDYNDRCYYISMSYGLNSGARFYITTKQQIEKMRLPYRNWYP